jgi:hypothetical protein
MVIHNTVLDSTAIRHTQQESKEKHNYLIPQTASFTNIPAAPMPLPTHMVVQRTCLFWRRSSAKPVTTWRTPADNIISIHRSCSYQTHSLMPNGWVKAMEPPLRDVSQQSDVSVENTYLGLILAIGTPSCSTQYANWLANASLISQISTSSLESPVLSKTAGIAVMGEMPMYRGSTPTTADATHFPTMSIPRASAFCRVVSTQIAAPSPMPDALPAVVVLVPQSGKTGFRPAREVADTFGRIVSSVWIVLPRISIGRISSEKIPFFSA